MKPILLITAVLACAVFGPSPVYAADETNKAGAAPERIGIYDSRAIAYAHFWSEAQQRKRDEMSKDARSARAAGQTERYKEQSAALKKLQEQSHLQVFSTAPVDNILAEMKDRLPEIQRKARVARLVSKWDEETLKDFKRVEKVDVTDLLLGEFKLDEKQKKVAADLRTKNPLPLKRAENLMKEGKL
jgi:hypothetical protein